ncbi:fructose-1,6-bisphosphatase [Lacticaseibacillus saniviri]|uniref:Fructose-1,6-bisphosphatase class 3 n=1 Tax=Lacticaseibacillus saniviri JCM 17471 = DSM 24301 TaxID=1293598 RepID=A0A0R2MU78_9LACO|nr:fructose-1,6-bisphosphatase [Lacticaseibacillus saniviri]KRO17125.1 fructose-1,6-bisphosphatase [Lacticaseibacillus saniviri JCM 17471 = DSM 24301]
MTTYAELAMKYQTVPAVATEMVNLNAILSLPKPTEAFMSDIHGEYDAFQHVLRNGSGNVKAKIRDCFHDEMTEQTLQEFAFLVYYPSERVAAVQQQLQGDALQQWYLTTIQRLVRLLAFTATKYTRSKVRKAMAPEFVYITEELLYNDADTPDKLDYYWQIIKRVIALQQADGWIEATCRTIQRLTVDHIHIVGDIYDRGPAPDQVVESLIRRQTVDIQWGNHDILWLGGAAGSALCIANLIRISARYNNLAILEDAYGINLRHLALFAERYYQDNPAFRPNMDRNETQISVAERDQITKIHQAISIIQFKLEGPVIQRRPEFEMTHRLVLEHISHDGQSIHLNGHDYPLINGAFQTIDFDHPYALLPEEQELVDQLVTAFTHSEKLRRHLDFIMAHGAMFLRYNGNLLLHGCVPVKDDGTFAGLTINGKTYSGQALFEVLERNLRLAYAHPENKNDLATDLLWYLWTGPYSPLFGKHDMTTFERYFIDDNATHFETPNPYYAMRHDRDFIQRLLKEFGLNPQTGHVINGHTPVKKGDSPLMAANQMIVIDGGFSKPYQKTTGIGGYTLLDNSYGMQLVTHQPFTSKQAAIANLTDIVSTKRVVQQELHRRTVAETDIGQEIIAQLTMLGQLLSDLRG